MNTTFFFENETQAKKFSKELRKCFILSENYGHRVEIYNFPLIKEECKKDVLGMANKIYKEVITDMSAVDKFQQMTMQECIDLWNEYGVDQFNPLSKIHAMAEGAWWNHLAKELGAWELLHAVWDSEKFCDKDLYFAYFEDGNDFISFSTKQEMIEVMGEEWFIETLMSK